MTSRRPTSKRRRRMVAAGTRGTSGTSGRAVVPARPSAVAARPSDREHVPSHSFGLNWSWWQ